MNATTKIPNLHKMETETLAYMLRNATSRLNDVIAKGYFASTIETYRTIRDEIAAELNSRNAA